MLFNLIGFTFLFVLIKQINCFDVVYAINAGGDEHVDSNGLYYARDPLIGQKIGIASDFGKQILSIGRVPSASDGIIYQTERYHTATFGYDIPITSDGDYCLVLKFCEVYFTAPNMKVFDVQLNGEHIILNDFDIFQRASGRGIAHDEYIYFTVSRGRLFYKEDESDIRGGRIRVEFIKGNYDNPKINGIVLIRGTDLDQIPKLPPLQHMHQDVDINHNYKHQRDANDIDDDEDGDDDDNDIDNDGNVAGDGFEDDEDEIVQINQQQRREKRHQPEQKHSKYLNEYDDDDDYNNDGNNHEHNHNNYDSNDDNNNNVNNNNNNNRQRKTSGPKQDDPYSSDDSSIMFPIFIAIGTFIPLLFCLCKL